MFKIKIINVVLVIIIVVGATMMAVAFFKINISESSAWRQPLYVFGTIIFAVGLVTALCKDLKGPYS